MANPPIDPASLGTPLDPSDPRRLGDYELLRRLGHGGMGIVYLGRADDGAYAAVKAIRTDFADDAAYVARFRREAENARRVVARSCTARVLDSGVDGDGRPFLVTEYIPGPTLAQAVSPEDVFEPADVEQFAVVVLNALAGIHNAGVVHRDLKPSNVVLSPTGPRVIDFGIARALDDTTFTDGVSPVGTLGYMAPEQILGMPAGQAADVFAWAATVAFAANGFGPFGTGDRATLIHPTLKEPPNLGRLDTTLRPLVEQALSTEPADRPTVQKLLDTLHGHLDPDPQPPIVGPPPDWPPTRRLPRLHAWLQQLRRGRGLVAVAAVLAAGVGAVVTIATPDRDPESGNIGANTGNWRVDQHPRGLADTNGDSRADIVGFGDDGVFVSTAREDGTFNAPRLAVEHFGYNAGSWRVERHPRTVTDITGDGRADIVGFADAGVFVSTAREDGTFNAPTLAIDNFGHNAGNAGGWRVGRHLRLLADITGDGRADIVGFADAGVFVSTAREDGTFNAPKLAIDRFGSDSGGWRVDRHPRLLADTNGDGRADIVGFGYGSVFASTAREDGTFSVATPVVNAFGFDPES